MGAEAYLIDYFTDVIGEAAEQCGLCMTREQEAFIGKHVAQASDTREGLTYQPPNPLLSENVALERKLAAERAKRGCPDCGGSGRLQYMTGPWYCDSQCDTCHGDGKI